MGGDGTWSNVGNAILASGRPAELGLVPGGTGCDLAKSLGIPPRDVHACCRIILDGATRAIDVGRIEDRHFLNIAGFGYDVAVLEDSWSVSYLEGSLLYLYCALRQLGSYRASRWRPRPTGRSLGPPGDAHGHRGQRRRSSAAASRWPRGRIWRTARLDAVSFANMGFGGRASALVRLLLGRHAVSPPGEPALGDAARLPASTPRRPTRPTGSGTRPADRSWSSSASRGPFACGFPVETDAGLRQEVAARVAVPGARPRARAGGASAWSRPRPARSTGSSSSGRGGPARPGPTSGAPTTSSSWFRGTGRSTRRCAPPG